MTTPIPKVRLLGTTWASRGWRYWNRRFWIALLYTAIAAFEFALAFSIFSAFTRSSSDSTRLWVAVVAVTLVGGGFIWALHTLWLIIRAELRGNIPELRAMAEKNRGGRRKQAGLAGAALGVGGLAGVPAVILTLLVGTFAVLGWVFVVFVMGLMPYLSIEEYLAMHDLRESKRPFTGTQRTEAN